MTAARCQSSRAGHNLHPIQISKASRGDYGLSMEVEVIEVRADGVVLLREGDATVSVWHHRPGELRDVLGRAAQLSERRGSMLRVGGRWFSVEAEPADTPTPVCEPPATDSAARGGAGVSGAHAGAVHPAELSFEDANPWRFADQVRRPQQLDPVERALDGLVAALGIEDEWSVRRPGVITWTPYEQSVEIVGTLWAAPGGDLVRVRMRSTVVKEARADVGELLDEMMAMGVAMGVAPFTAVRSADDPDVKPSISFTAVTHLPVEPDICLPDVVRLGWRVASHISHRTAVQLAEKVSGTPAMSNHPIQGRRHEPSDWLKVGRYLVGDERPPGPTEATLEGLADVEALPWLAGKVIDSRFRGFFSLMTHKSDVAVTMFRRRDQVAVVDVDLAEHPVLGAGVRVVMSLSHDDISDSAALALDLNGAESNDFVGFDVFGTWAGDPEDGEKLYHFTYVPAVAIQTGLLERVLHQHSFRVRWAAQRLGLDGGFNDFVEMTGGTD